MTTDVSQVLAERMLQGWVLLDETCKTCHRIPLMRSPKGATSVVYFCASCDGRPDSVPQNSAESVSSSSHLSRASTPPTEVSSTLSSPVFAPPPVTEESRRRAEQSDIASAEIGRRLLKGYAMLGEICPSDSCFGVPLVRPPPKPGGEKDPRKECVICGTVYLTEIVSGVERLVSEQPDSAPSAPSKGKTREVEKVIEEEESLAESYKPSSLKLQQPALLTVSAPSTLLSALDEAANQLESTLRGLSTKLAASMSKDPASIGTVADAISKVVQALHQVKSLQWAEKNA